MSTLLSWYHSLPPALAVYWTVALFASLVFAIQMVLTFVGIGHTDGMDADLGGDLGDADGHTLDTGGALQLFTVRNVVNFLLGLGWGGVCFFTTISSPVLLALVAVVVGALFVALFLLLFRSLMRLESHGNFSFAQCKGLSCDVYLRIPARREGVGKVQISVEGSVHELPALTDGPQLPSGAKVRVVDIIEGTTLLVKGV